jgi:hypothetical protein
MIHDVNPNIIIALENGEFSRANSFVLRALFACARMECSPFVVLGGIFLAGLSHLTSEDINQQL